MSAIRRSVWLFLILSLAALGLSVLGVAWAFRNTAATGSRVAPEGGTRPVSSQVGVVCAGYVDLENGTTPLAAMEPGRVEKVLVREQEKVAAGTPLLLLETGSARARVAEAKAALASTELQIEQARLLPARHQLALAMQRDAIAAAQQRVAAALNVLAQKEQLAERQLINSRESAVARAQLEELQALADAEQKKQADLRLRDTTADLRKAEVERDLMRARLQQAEQALAECVLKAPAPGTVVRILVTPGEVLPGPGKQALLFAAEEPLIIRAEVEQEFAGQVVPGQKVRVVDDLHPEQSWQGMVRRVSAWYMRRRTVLQDPARFNDTRTRECIIAVEAPTPPLVLGQRVRVLIGPVEP